MTLSGIGEVKADAIMLTGRKTAHSNRWSSFWKYPVLARKRWKSCVRRFACEFLANAATFRHPDSSKKIASFVLAGVLHPAHLIIKNGGLYWFFPA